MPGTLKWFKYINLFIHGGFPGGSDSKELPGMQENLHSIPGLGRSSGEGNGYPSPVFLPGEFHGKGAWQATVHGVAKSRTQLSD